MLATVANMKTNRPVILLFGMPRSGTTWVGKIFDSHPDTLYRHEPDTWIKINDVPLLPERENYKEYCDCFSKYVSSLDSINLPQVTSKYPLFRKSYSSWLNFYAYKLSAYVSTLIGRVGASIMFPTISPVRNGGSDKIILVWKSIQLLGRMGTIVRCIDGCKAIHILRHPCGYVSSILQGEEKNKFVSTTPASEDYDLFNMLMETKQAERYGLNMGTIKRLTSVERLAWRWVLFNEKALDDTENMPEVIRLRYEELCESPVKKVKELFNLTGLAWNPQTEEFLNKSTEINKKSYYSVYKKPLESSNKWKGSMGEKEIEEIISIIKKTKIGKLYLNM